MIGTQWLIFWSVGVISDVTSLTTQRQEWSERSGSGFKLVTSLMTLTPQKISHWVIIIISTFHVFWIHLWMPYPTFLPTSDSPATPTAATWLFNNSCVCIYKRHVNLSTCINFFQAKLIKTSVEEYQFRKVRALVLRLC